MIVFLFSQSLRICQWLVHLNAHDWEIKESLRKRITLVLNLKQIKYSYIIIYAEYGGPLKSLFNEELVNLLLLLQSAWMIGHFLVLMYWIGRKFALRLACPDSSSARSTCSFFMVSGVTFPVFTRRIVLGIDVCVCLVWAWGPCLITNCHGQVIAESSLNWGN